MQEDQENRRRRVELPLEKSLNVMLADLNQERTVTNYKALQYPV